MGGGGFLHQMTKTLEQNKKLRSRNSVFGNDYNRRYERESSTSDPLESKPVDQQVLDGIRKKLKRQRRGFIMKRLSLFVVLSAVIGSAVFWTMTTSMENYPRRVYMKKKADSFVIMGVDENGLDVRIEYFPYGSKRAETKYKNGKRHQQSESYYETGEQFRAAAYFHDDLVTEVYFYKSGDTISSFPTITDLRIHHIKLENPDQSRLIEFDVTDGKIVPDSYQESFL